jgi:cell division protein FtsI/penicillin-binding protein 2
VITLRRSHYRQVKERIYPLPGTRFMDDTMPLAPTREFARAFLGAAGPVTAEIIDQSHGRYVMGDIAGLTGLQREFDERLRGEPGYVVEIVRRGSSETLIEESAQPGDSVTTTLDLRIQQAAEDALSTETHPSALVAIRISDGRVLALANGPDGGSYDSARVGRYPPGSTFKVLTTMALLAGNLDPNEIVDCPATAWVEGKEFGNAEDHVLGEIPFSTGFAQSCNTAFVGLSSRLEPGALSETASLVGVGVEWSPGVAAFTGDVPRATDAIDLAAASIGQGRVLLSPLGTADLAATVARGRWMRPTLVEKGGNGDRPDFAPLPTRMTETLQRLMRAVVTNGTRRALAVVPGEPVYGKTGTAEYGNEVPPRTHAWFMGYQGDLAFAVLVAETADSFGGEVAAPIAADFLTRINSD